MVREMRTVCGTILTVAVCLSADVLAGERSVLRLGAPFADHAVFQRGRVVPVWGEAAAGEKVSVSFAGQEKNAVAGEDGSWRVNLDPLDACAVGRDLVVASSGGGRLTVSDILFDCVDHNKLWKILKEMCREPR